MPRLLPTIPDVDQADAYGELVEARVESQAVGMMNQVLQENLAQIELMLEDQGWSRFGGESEDLTASGRSRARAVTRFMATTNPLIKRGLTLRAAYVWGLGVTVMAKDTEEGQDVNAVLQRFLESNRATYSGTTARVRQEWALGTDGEVFLAAKTDRITGAVDMSVFPPEEVDDVLTDPDNKRRPWYYLRTFRARETMPDGAVREVEKRVAYPAMGHRLKVYPDSIPLRQHVYAMQTDTFVRHVAVNQPGTSIRGVGDAFASLPWARAHKEFLEQWALLMKALARYAWRHKAPAGKSRQVAADLAATTPGLAQTHVESPGYDLEAIPKTGATIDADSGKPLAAYVAAGMGVAVTILLGDPGQTGARAVAETMTEPGYLEMGLRRALWAEVEDDVAQHVIDSAVIAPQGQLRGRQVLDPMTGRVSVVLPDQDDRTVLVSFPPYGKTPVAELSKAIADFTGNLPMPGKLQTTLVRLFLEANGLDDIDEFLDEITDDDGNLVDPQITAGDRAVDRFNQGDDPAAAFGGSEQ